jgi:hypothetical protein
MWTPGGRRHDVERDRSKSRARQTIFFQRIIVRAPYGAELLLLRAF